VHSALWHPDPSSAPGAVCTYSFPLGTENHEAGTLPLGSILDDDHQFRGLAGLYAVGPAVFPRAGAANPALTILALASVLQASWRRIPHERTGKPLPGKGHRHKTASHVRDCRPVRQVAVQPCIGPRPRNGI